MSTVWVIAWRELKSMLVSPVAWAVLGLFLFIYGAFFWIFLAEFSAFSSQLYQYAGQPDFEEMLGQVTLNEWVLRPLFGNLQVVFLLLVPALTMRLFSEEKKQGTYEFVLTSPVSVGQLVVGKYLAGVMMAGLLLLASVVYPAILYLLGEPETAPLLTGYLGLFLVAASFVAVGTLASALTENQIIAAVLTFSILLFFWIVSWAASAADSGAAEVLTALSFLDRAEDFAKGVLDSRHLVYHLSFIAFFLLLTGRAVEAHRWKE